ncbi:MAG: sulfatase [Phycisphaerae bacterium]|nr:sulfatase [Phycisphaerae bacterium]
MEILDRRDFLKVTGLAAMTAIMPTVTLAANQPKYNVLFIAVDDLRPELGCYGHKTIKSPNIDKLAEMGTLFEYAYCQQAVCGPSRASLLSGLRPDYSKVHDLQTPLRQVNPNITTLPQHFKNNGYETISIGKIYHHRTEDDPQGWSIKPMGASGGKFCKPENIALQIKSNDFVKKVNAEAKAIKDIQKRKQHQRKVYQRPAVPYYENADVSDNGYADGMETQMAIKEIKRLKDKPFFLAMGYHKPHLPFNSPKKYWDMYKDEDLQISDIKDWPKDSPEVGHVNWGELKMYIDGEKANQPEHTKRLIRAYYACVTYVDAQIGKLIDALKTNNLLEKTIIVLWGDHGWKLGEYSAWCKHTNYELDTHGPLMFYAPGYKANQKSKALVEFVDIYPTLADLAGLEIPKQCQGSSLTALLKDGNKTWKPAAFSQYPRGIYEGYSIRTDKYRYTEWINRKTKTIGERELYDHSTSPIATENLANKPEYTDTVKKLSKLLNKGDGWRKMK